MQQIASKYSNKNKRPLRSNIRMFFFQSIFCDICLLRNHLTFSKNIKSLYVEWGHKRCKQWVMENNKAIIFLLGHNLNFGLLASNDCIYIAYFWRAHNTMVFSFVQAVAFYDHCQWCSTLIAKYVLCITYLA